MLVEEEGEGLSLITTVHVTGLVCLMPEVGVGIEQVVLELCFLR